MDKNDPYDIARAIASQKLWKAAVGHGWALLPQSSAEPYIALIVDESDKPKSLVEWRLLLFQGLPLFRDFVISREVPDYGVETGPLEFRRYEVVGRRDGAVDMLAYEPGFVPADPDPDSLREITRLLVESYGFMMRLEGEPDLPMTYGDRKAMFARKEVVEGVWVDGPLIVPQNEVVQQTERIELVRAVCDRAKELPVFPKEVWEVDFSLMPMFQTPGPKPRFLYLLAAVKADDGKKMVWEGMSVDGKEGGVKRLWEGIAQMMLQKIVKIGRVPGEMHVRNGRMMRFLRPLGLHLPFKLVQHGELPKVDAVVKCAIEKRRLREDLREEEK